ncbi:Aste57867_14041 [Aphanomyces stellatus]|uniref:Aste57867_14041 protein n=1 Tax=Aphanomyces stellatus TaxID=120398 RepID=A0A485L0I0_9STRA|nr:hypothetical protein As57867_013990 [Aphanomyces stellatus]VFT90871.1 Aste57867_14041 [Aphanomyces stellatus]
MSPAKRPWLEGAFHSKRRQFEARRGGMLSAAAAMPDTQSRNSTMPALSERAQVLSRLLERQTRKQTVTLGPGFSVPQSPKGGRRVRRDFVVAPIVPSSIHPKAIAVSPASHTATLGADVNLIPVTKSIAGTLPQAAASHTPQGRIKTLRGRVWALFHDTTSSFEARCLSTFILMTVTLSIVSYIVQTQPDLDGGTKAALSFVENVCIYIFTFDFVVRLVCTPKPKQFALDVFNWIDFVSIIPYYLELLVDAKPKAGMSLNVIRTMRLLRVARILKLSRYTSSLQIFLKALALSIKPLSMLVLLMSIAMVIFSTMLYFAEATDSLCRNPLYSKTCHPYANPSPTCCDLNPFTSIPATFWWCIVSMTTVGYGESVPVTPLGKVIASLTMMSGTVILALPISVIGANFQRIVKETSQDALQKHIQVVTNMDVIRREEMIQVLRGFEIVGDNVHIDPDELIALYDMNQSGSLEDEELENFRGDLTDLQHVIHHHAAHIVSPERERRLQRLSFRGSFKTNEQQSRQLEMIEQMIETRLLESEVRMEAKLHVVTKALLRLQAQLELVGD